MTMGDATAKLAVPALVVESIRALPTRRVSFAHTKIVHVVEGSADIVTELGAHRLAAGESLALGGGYWCQIRPRPSVRLWTMYAEDEFVRTLMGWFLPDKTRVRPGIHPQEWDGGPIFLAPGVALVRKLEPLWRRMSILHDGGLPPEVVAVRTIEMFSQWVGLAFPTFLAPGADSGDYEPVWKPAVGSLADLTVVGYVGSASRLLRERMTEPWTVTALARAVSVSRTHLTRLFTRHIGLAPMRYLTEVRVTEFTRLIEETDLSVASAAKQVGWSDPRIASMWFSRRYTITPSQYRLNPHPHRTGSEACPDCE